MVLAMPVLAALLALLPRRTAAGGFLALDQSGPGRRLAEVRLAGLVFPDDSFRELPDDCFTVRIDCPERLCRVLKWAAKKLPGDFYPKFNPKNKRQCRKTFGIRLGGKGKICVQLGRGRDSGFKAAIRAKLKYWHKHPPSKPANEADYPNTDYERDRTLRKLFKEIDRLAKCLQCYDFRHDYVHLYTHTMESATALHGDDNLTFDNKKQVAARALLTSAPRPLEFVINNIGKFGETSDRLLGCTSPRSSGF